MELPFLKNQKNKQNSAGGVVVQHADRTKDMDDNKALIEHVADEFMSAIEKKDRALMVDALRALVLHIQDEDQAQDEASDSE